jgi:hypothetical protein
MADSTHSNGHSPLAATKADMSLPRDLVVAHIYYKHALAEEYLSSLII